MKVRRWVVVFSAAALLCCYAPAPAYAQKSIKKFIQKILAPYKKTGSRNLPSVLPRINPKSLDAVAFSKISNRGARVSVAPLFNADVPSIAPRPLMPAPAEVRRAVFTLQYNPQTHGKGSAFAIDIDGEVWGVTARHVLDDISRSPYMSVPDENGNPLYFQVHSVREGNVHGADLAIFRIPPQALAYVSPLKPDYVLPEANTDIQSAGFSHGNFGWFSRIGVLFSSSHRILTRYEDFPIRNGYCGSPLLKDGKVIGVFAGIITADLAQSAEWFRLLSDFKTSITSFSHVVPVAWVRTLAQQGKNPNDPNGVPLKLLGHTLRILHADENVQTIQHLRDGKLIKALHSYPFMDYNHLERFLDIGPNDVIRVFVQKGDRSSSRRYVFIYEWDVQAATLKRMESR